MTATPMTTTNHVNDGHRQGQWCLLVPSLLWPSILWPSFRWPSLTWSVAIIVCGPQWPPLYGRHCLWPAILWPSLATVVWPLLFVALNSVAVIGHHCVCGRHCRTPLTRQYLLVIRQNIAFTWSRTSARDPTMCMAPDLWRGSRFGVVSTWMMNPIVFWRTSRRLPAAACSRVCAAIAGLKNSSYTSKYT